jgi:hypothetical protein
MGSGAITIVELLPRFATRVLYSDPSQVTRERSKIRILGAPPGATDAVVARGRQEVDWAALARVAAADVRL